MLNSPLNRKLRMALIGGGGAACVNQRAVKSAAGGRFTKPASQFGITQQAGDHGDIVMMAVGYFPGHDQSEDKIDRLSVSRVEVYRIGQLYHRRNAAVDPFDTAMREGNARLQAGATEPFTFDQAREYVVRANIGLRPDQQFTQDFETVLLAARVGIAEHCVRIDDFFQQHGFLLFLR